MQLVIYCTSYRLNKFQALPCPSSAARDYDVDYHTGCIVLGLLFVGGKVQLGWSGVWVAGSSTRLQPATKIPPQTSNTETPTHIETRTHDQCGDTIEKSQAPDDGCINVRNMLSIEEVKKKLIPSDIKLVSYSSPNNDTFIGRVARSVQRLAMGWMVRGSNPGGGQIFCTCPD